MHESETEFFHGNIDKEQHGCLDLKIMLGFHFWGPGNELSFWNAEYEFSLWIFENIQDVARFPELKGEVCAGVKDFGVISRAVIIKQ